MATLLNSAPATHFTYNTYQLELRYGWSGIVAEPARTWHSELTSNRKCIIDLRCVWARSGDSLTFNETENAEQSTINTFAGMKGTHYTVPTISLNDLLSEHNAPGGLTIYRSLLRLRA